eukprot:CAMPEP_0178443458 /NCGR_PEP_ID=MMETSP0689_2-20121128/38909_1 /TAXON_ID=160604 /ORGANISM="Amphidinium massartii, Strain CS-259" /LENGTH=565 /DNA_ID=CAMNT_0020067473 /DNA_START=1 /DNA_END=1698 /DNA_ORIENTATION=+
MSMAPRFQHRSITSFTKCLALGFSLLQHTLAFITVLMVRPARQTGDGRTGLQTPIEAFLATCRQIQREAAAAATGFQQVSAQRWKDFLQSAEACAKELRIEPHSRDYRVNFTANYTRIFPSRERHYRYDLLEASLKDPECLWVNGDKFSFSDDVVGRARALRVSLTALVLASTCSPECIEVGALRRGKPRGRGLGSTPSIQAGHSLRWLSTLVFNLQSFDSAWAHFEHEYVMELIAIESLARSTVAEAVMHESELAAMEANGYRFHDAECEDPLANVVTDMRKILTCCKQAGCHFDIDVLVKASEILASPLEEWPSESPAVARKVAVDVLQAFHQVRQYLAKVRGCLEKVNPQFVRNSDLVDCLENFEEICGSAGPVLSSESAIRGFSQLVANIRRDPIGQLIAVSCEACDIELFLSLPRLIILELCTMPQPMASLLQHLLPDELLQDTDHDGCQQCRLRELVNEFQEVIHHLIDKSCRDQAVCTLRQHFVRELSASCVDHVELPRTAASNDANLAVVRSFARSVEVWSMALQRTNAEEWNGFVALLIQHLGDCDLTTSPAVLQS